MRAACERGALACAALGCVVLAHALEPVDAARRAEGLVVAVLALGYGHLLGAAWLGWPRLRARRPHGMPALLFGAWLAAGGLTALALWGWAAPRAPWLPLLLLAVFLWHTVENDLALFREGGLAAATPPRSADPARRALALAWTLAAGIWVAATPAWRDGVGVAWGLRMELPLRLAAAAAGGVAWLRGDAGARRGAAAVWLAAALPAPTLALVDLFAASTLYHLFTWLGVLARRVRRLRRTGDAPEAQRLAVRMAAVHAVPATACVAVSLAPADTWPALRAWLLAPGLYLLLSTLHVVQTGLLRPVSPRAVGETP